MRRRLLAAMTLAVSVLVWSPPGLAGWSVSESAAAGSAIHTVGATPDDAGNIIGSPNAGPKPQNSGDRGGWAQLLILGVLTAAVSFIMWRIFHDARGGKNTTPT